MEDTYVRLINCRYHLFRSSASFLLLGRDPNRSWCHIHTEQQHTHMLLPMSMEPWVVIKKALLSCGGDTSSCPVPTQQPLVLSFTLVVGKTRTFHLAVVYVSSFPEFNKQPTGLSEKLCLTSC